jgi:deaminated glutathione amidase
MKIALIQMTSCVDIATNLDYLTQQIREAAGQGASFILTPENSDFMIDGAERKISTAYDEGSHPFIPAFKKLAKELKVTILLGSIAVKIEQGKLNNRSYLFSPQGDILASYNKIHLFDVDLPTGEKRRESQMITAGDAAILSDSGFAKIGMTICYDVRFPHLFRTLAQAGANIITIPSAFTVPTGEMHWEVLLRARAIENGAYVIAPAQCGTHDGGRQTYGHSMVIDPWGKIICEAGIEPTIIYAEIDLTEVIKCRQAIPSLSHDREYTLGKYTVSSDVD